MGDIKVEMERTGALSLERGRAMWRKSGGGRINNTKDV